MKTNFTKSFFCFVAISVFLVSCASYDSQRGNQERIDRHHQRNQVPNFQ